jgi:hypothetical protein
MQKLVPTAKPLKCMKFMQWVATLIIFHASIHLTDVTITCNMKNMYPQQGKLLLYEALNNICINFYSFSVHPGNTLLWYPTGALVSFSLQLII